MIWYLLFIPITLLINMIFTLLPATPQIAADLTVLAGFLRKGMYFTHAEVFAVVISTFIACEMMSLTWNIIKFVYSKIPFLNIR